MGKYVNHTLSSGEQVMCTAHYHWIWWAKRVAVYVVLIGLCYLLSVAAGIGLALLGVGILVSLIGIGYALLRYTHDEIVVTSHRVVMKTGIIARDAFELQIQKVESILVDQTVMGRVLNFGSVACCGTGGTTSSKVVIADPLAFRAAFQNAVARTAGGASFAASAVPGVTVAPGGPAAGLDSAKLDEMIALLKEISAKLDR